VKEGLLCLTSLSTIFQLYRGSYFYWWRKSEYPEKTIHLSLVIDNFYHIMFYRISFTIACTVYMCLTYYLRESFKHPALYLMVSILFTCGQHFHYIIISPRREAYQWLIQGRGGVKSWFFTRNTPNIFAPPSAIGKNMIFWRKIVIFRTQYPKNFRASLRSAQFFKCAPLTWNPGSAPAYVHKTSLTPPFLFTEESLPSHKSEPHVQKG
jgi:hypothetical protein